MCNDKRAEAVYWGVTGQLHWSRLPPAALRLRLRLPLSPQPRERRALRAGGRGPRSWAGGPACRGGCRRCRLNLRRVLSGRRDGQESRNDE